MHSPSSAPAQALTPTQELRKVRSELGKELKKAERQQANGGIEWEIELRLASLRDALIELLDERDRSWATKKKFKKESELSKRALKLISMPTMPEHHKPFRGRKSQGLKWGQETFRFIYK